MAKASRYRVTMMALSALIGSLGLSALSGHAADPPAISDGSKVTLLYQITVPGDERFEVRDLSQFVQGQHQMLPAVEQAVTGMHRGEKTEVKLSEDQAFGAVETLRAKLPAARDAFEARCERAWGSAKAGACGVCTECGTSQGCS